MDMRLRPFVRFAGKVPKNGNSHLECEDSFRVTEAAFAVADGASDAIYSDVWSGILADSYCRTSEAHSWDAEHFSDWIAGCRSEWRRWEEQLADKELPWFVREKLQSGSFATFAGLSFSPDRSGAWKAFAYGDACLFVVRGDALALSFPLTASDQFDNAPSLISTVRHLTDDRIRVAEGIACPGDRFYLVTDALAQWFLADYERGEKPWIAFDYGISGDAELDLFVTEVRERRSLKNDDVTLVSLEVLTDE